MFNRFGKVAFLGIVSVLAVAFPARADPITTLFNTGVLDDGRPAPAGSTDLHYTAVYCDPHGNEVPSPVLVPSFFPQSWVPNSDFAQWVWAVPPGSTPDRTTIGMYDYQMKFDLTGLDPSSARISGVWAADDSGLDILINGVSTLQTASGPGEFTSFTIPDKALMTHNVLDFLVFTSAINPAGIQVVFTEGSADPVPEPAAGALLLLGAACLAGYGRHYWKRAWHSHSENSRSR